MAAASTVTDLFSKNAVTRLPEGPRPRGTTPLTLSFENVSMTYPDGTEALRDVSLDIQKSEFVSIIGPSGCGKSTLARIASGLLEHSEGQVYIDRDHLAFTFQEATLLPWRRVMANIELLMELRGVPAAQRRRIAQEQVDLVGLTGFENRFPRALSGGMKMRASLARSLSLNPSVFLFDEPFGALDEITRERLLDETSALHRVKGFTGVFITHSIPEAVFLSDRVVVMGARPGRIAAEFAVDLPHPRTSYMRFTPEFAAGCVTVSKALRQTIHPTGDAS
jgi:NitT/TauT family transport system ATP-binding protein